MRKMRLFRSLVLFGASLISVATLGLAVAGCGDDTGQSQSGDMAASPPDCGLPCAPHDMRPPRD